MWPFAKKPAQPPPDDVSRDGLTARFDSGIRHWVFECEGIQFWLSGIPFNRHAFAWAREAVPVIKNLEANILEKVADCLKEWDEINAPSAELLCVDLDEYAENKTMELVYTGDDSWGDLGINIMITNGQITDVNSGD
jgi:hypothetical protein